MPLVPLGWYFGRKVIITKCFNILSVFKPSTKLSSKKLLLRVIDLSYGSVVEFVESCGVYTTNKRSVNNGSYPL